MEKVPKKRDILFHMIPMIFVILSILVVIWTKVELVFCTEQVTVNEVFYIDSNPRHDYDEYTYSYEDETYTKKTLKFSNLNLDERLIGYVEPDKPEHIVIPEGNYKLASSYFGIGVVMELFFLVATFLGNK